MKTKIYLTSLIIISGLLYSCSTSVDVAKRRYNSGFYVDISSEKPATQIHSLPTKSKETKSEQDGLMGRDVTKLPLVDLSNISSSKRSENTDEDCDAIASTQKILSKPSVGNANSSSGKNTIAADRKVNFKTAMAFYKDYKKQVKDQKSSKSTKSGGKSWIAALLLCIFLGGIGIHRFYLGYTWQGVVQLLTLGGCGVWALIDLIRIIIKDLKPKDGDYES